MNLILYIMEGYFYKPLIFIIIQDDLMSPVKKSLEFIADYVSEIAKLKLSIVNTCG